MLKIQELTGLAAGPLCHESPEAHAGVPAPVQDLFAAMNGFYAFESALHVRGTCPTQRGYSSGQWNDPSLWLSRYDHIRSSGGSTPFFFAEDAFGAQFGLSPQGVSLFDPETGDSEIVCRTIHEWAGLVLDDFEYLTGYPVAHQWQVRHGPLRDGDRLVPKRPFVLGGEYSVDNLYPMEAVQSMHLRADIANQIRNLPDGASVRLKSD